MHRLLRRPSSPPNCSPPPLFPSQLLARQASGRVGGVALRLAVAGRRWALRQGSGGCQGALLCPALCQGGDQCARGHCFAGGGLLGRRCGQGGGASSGTRVASADAALSPLCWVFVLIFRFPVFSIGTIGPLHASRGRGAAQRTLSARSLGGGRLTVVRSPRWWNGLRRGWTEGRPAVAFVRGVRTPFGVVVGLWPHRRAYGGGPSGA